MAGGKEVGHSGQHSHRRLDGLFVVLDTRRASCQSTAIYEVELDLRCRCVDGCEALRYPGCRDGDDAEQLLRGHSVGSRSSDACTIHIGL